MKTEDQLIDSLAQSMERLLSELHAGSWNEGAYIETCDRLKSLAALWRCTDRVPRRVVPVLLGAVDSILSHISHYRDLSLQAELQEKAIKMEELIESCFVDPGDEQEFRRLKV